MNFLAQLILKLFELDEENKRLRTELTSRRNQADRWRKKYQSIELTKKQKQILADAEIMEVIAEGAPQS